MQIALASSASEEELEEYEKLLKISDLLAAETSSDDAEESKPDPDIFLAAFGKLKNVEKNEALIVGDTPYDAEAGRKAGIKVIWVLSGGWSREKLADAGCLEVFQDIAEIFEQFDQIIKGKSRTITSLG
jgi:phosphoglycolate phosphatase-like HAD superfamily hydrolase